jgi:hypothetical protein
LIATSLAVQFLARPNPMFADWRKRIYVMTKHYYHAVIWIDHREARVFHFNPTDVEKLVLYPDNPTRHIPPDQR